MLLSIWPPPHRAMGGVVVEAIYQDLWNTLSDLPRVREWEFPSRYGELTSKLEFAFSQEEEWMTEMNIPLLKQHREQHARILSGLHHVHAEVLAGNIALGRQVAECLLPRWLEFHGGMTNMASIEGTEIPSRKPPTKSCALNEAGIH